MCRSLETVSEDGLGTSCREMLVGVLWVPASWGHTGGEDGAEAAAHLICPVGGESAAMAELVSRACVRAV